MTAPARALPRLYYRPAEAAQVTGLSLRTVWRRIQSGAWRSRKDGGAVLIVAGDVDGTERERVADEDEKWAREALRV